MATMMQDTKLLAKMSGGDLVALEAKYHLTCLTKYRNSYRSYNRRSTQTTSEQDRVNARAFVELVSHIENAVEDGQHIFKLSDLHLLYQQRLGELGHNITVNRTRLKVKLLDYFGDLGIQEQTDGKNVALIFPSGMEEMLKTALVEPNYESEALLFAKVAKICRNEMFREGETVTFDGHFPKQCQDILPSTRLLVSMILYGTSLKSDIHDTQSSKTISQLLLHNSRKRKRTESSYSRHSLDHEAALPTYIGLNVHTLTRSKTMVDQLARLGISISYSRVLQLEDQLAASMCQQFHAEGIVCPSNLRKGLFCVGALDNIDYNPSSTTSQGSFHGSGISVIQFPSKSNPGTLRPSNPAPPVSRTDRASLPESFTIVDAVQLKPSSTNIPESNIVHVPVEGKLTEAKKSEEEWIEHATSFLGKSEVGKEDAVTWAAYHASKQLPDTENQPAPTALLPLFHEKADSPAMIKHAMNILKSITQYLNPGQIPVLACDCPIFANSKYIQWKWPANYGEDKIIIMFGGLHLEKAMWTALGDLLSHSGWTNALTDSGISSAGTSDSFLKSSHITRSRHAHQLTALALSKLQIEAYNQNQKQDGESFHTWREDMIRKSPTFQFWDLVLQTEIEILIFIRAHRTKDFDLYVESLKDLMFLFFALDHYNYSRWVSVHVRDMESLSPEFRDDFQKYWVVNKTCHRFSAIPIDQVHEQENAKVKGKGGVIGLTENPDAFQRWMIAGPEQARLLAEFEEDYLPDEDPEINYKHHEEGFAVQKAFVKQTDSLIQVIREYGNPFQDDCPELLVLNTRDCADESVIHTVRHIREIGCEQYSTFQQEVFVNREKAIHDSIKKNSLPLFKTVTKPRGKDKKKMTALRNDVNLFGRLYIANQQRYGDLSVFFSHENQLFPPSLSDDGKLRTPTSKSELLKCLDTDEQPECPQRFDCKIFDGAALVHSLPLSSATTFADYGDMVFKPYIKQELQKVNRVDLVWDRYYQSSLKKTTREKRGIGIRRKVTPTTKVPTKWKDFLSDSHNKEELFAYLTQSLSSDNIPTDKELYITSGTSVVSLGTSENMEDCSHEEADTRILVHLLDAVKKNRKKIIIRTVDTDVVTILISQFYSLIVHHPDIDIWVAFGMGKSFRHYSINYICNELGEDKSRALPVFHCFTGSDTTSCFFGKGKRSAWKTWKSYPDATSAFLYMGDNPFHPVDGTSHYVKCLERFTVLLYDVTSNHDGVNEARRELFSKKSRELQNIPPTQDAFLQHVKRTAYQGGIWSTSLQSQPMVPSPEGWGWTLKDAKWEPVWMTIPEAARACMELISCKCKSERGCQQTNRCKCNKSGLSCTELCSCKCEI